MEITRTVLPDLYIIKPRVYEDERGYFLEKYRTELLMEEGLVYRFVQENQSLSLRGVIRGLHYQLAPYAQTKLVHAVSGEIWDVAVDLRSNSPTFGQWYGEILSGENHFQMYIPRGFAHGFSVLSDQAIVEYKCDQVYHPASERGITFNDPVMQIDWKTDPDKAVLSARDKRLPGLREAEMNFLYGQ